MSTFLEIKIKQMTLDDINAELNSGKYISLLKKEKLQERKELLESKDLTIGNKFPSLNGSEPEPEPEPEISNLKGSWQTKSKKILDGSNAPVIKQKIIIKNKKKTQTSTKKVEYYSDDDELIDYNDGY